MLLSHTHRARSAEMVSFSSSSNIGTLTMVAFLSRNGEICEIIVDMIHRPMFYKNISRTSRRPSIGCWTSCVDVGHQSPMQDLINSVKCLVGWSSVLQVAMEVHRKKTKPTLARSQKETGEIGDLVIVCLLVCGDLFIVELNVHLFCGFFWSVWLWIRWKFASHRHWVQKRTKHVHLMWGWRIQYLFKQSKVWMVSRKGTWLEPKVFVNWQMLVDFVQIPLIQAHDSVFSYFK